MRKIGLAIVAWGLGCSIGSETGGLGSAASVGAGNDTDAQTGGATVDDDGDASAGSGNASATSVGPADTDAPPPGGEVCNGLDDDGDGLVDEDQPSQSCGIGACEVVVSSCEGGVPQACTPLPPGVESCNGTDDDCDGSIDEDLSTACSTACGDGVAACVGGVSQPCDAPMPQAEACNLDDDDCNGTIDDVGGCRVGVHRSYHPATGEHFYTASLPEAQCCGFTLEFADYYDLYSGPQPGLVPFHRCLTPSGKHFYTQSPTCEGTTVEGVLGYIATAAGTAGSGPLYRLYLPGTSDHFYTTSAGERDGAIASGYQDEGVAGYVW